jgi:hypothetical protein
MRNLNKGRKTRQEKKLHFTGRKRAGAFTEACSCSQETWGRTERPKAKERSLAEAGRVKCRSGRRTSGQ